VSAPDGLTTAQLATLAAVSCGAAYGGVTVVEGGQARLEAAYGFEASTLPPIAALCEQVIRDSRLVLLSATDTDTAADSRMAELGMFVGAPITTRDGTTVGVLWAAGPGAQPCPLADPSALLTAMANQIAMYRDLQETRLQYERALALVEGAAFRATADGVLSWVSPSWVTVTGHAVGATLGRPLSAYFRGAVTEAIEHTAADADDRPPRRLECSLLTADGAAIPVELALTRLPTEDRSVPGVIGVVTDLRERQKRELEARHDQKLEALGRLSAGIAHEINTPIQFVGDNTRFLASAYQEMLDLLLVYRACMDGSAGGSSWEERSERAAKAEGAADIDYLTTEVPAAVEQSLEGIDRVASLVRAMKSFSYKDSSDRSYSDLNEALTTTLTVARNEVKYVADVVLDLGELPEVLCHVGDLNQVFLNLLVNAADALQEKGERGEIRVSTRAEGTTAVIGIADNGPGIPADLQRVIFEPFFTTKEVGKGTGQGLALARAVVADKHGGTIEVHSAPGQGTEFVIRLPIDGTRLKAG
jgi:PAS domain S-box-containing protein